MLTTFRETWISLQDKNYGPVIISRPLRSVIWYWLKYTLFLAFIAYFFFLGLVTYFIPQLPRLFRTYLPEGQVSLNSGRLSSTLPEPVIIGDPNEFVIFLSTQSDPVDLDNFSSGLFLLSDKYQVKQPGGQVDSATYASIPSFTLSKSDVVSWFSLHPGRIWLTVFLASLLIAAVLTLGFSTYHLSLFFLWAVPFWFLGRILRKNLKYPHAFRIVVYASILPLLLSAGLSFASDSVSAVLQLVVFLYFGISWIRNLKPSK